MMIPCHTHPVSSGQKAGGKGTAEVLSVIDPSVFQGQNQMLARVVLQPGCSIGCHRHSGNSEVYYILSGAGSYSDNGTVLPVNAGDTTFCSDGESHSMENTGNEPLVFIALITNSPHQKKDS